ncbi:hypothetical protein [Alteromonas flava]|uniref:hypothetical protein n=1 Tax=Alteromonas flava TaxID=2048003 RepID=UPI000F5DE0EA|nr:hypothetical protein [Alteromonas flava]
MKNRGINITSRCIASSLAAAVLVSGTMSYSGSANSYELEPWLRGAVTSRDVSNRPSLNTIDQDSWLIEARLGIRDQVSSQWSWFADVRALAANDNTFLSDQTNDVVREDGSSDSYFLQVREAYLRYSGLTPYPEEYLTIGLQRLADADGFWWDADIESISWQADTTQLDWLVAIGREFDTYRTDADLSAVNKDVTRAFAGFDWDWVAYHSIGFNYMRQSQSTDLAEARFSDNALGKNATVNWYGVKLMSNWHQRQGPSPLAYKLEWIAQRGDTSLVRDNALVIPSSIDADAIDAGVRYDFAKWSVGLTYTRGSGGLSAGESNNFVQSGLHTNRGQYFGGRQRLIRFNEALRADITNLLHSGLFVSYRPNLEWEAVVLLGDYQKSDAQENIFSLTREIETQAGNKDVGNSLDVNLTYTPQNPFYNMHLLRLRAGVFSPGDAMLRSGTDYRITLDAQFWYW